MLIACSTVEPGSVNYKATILYFGGGTGEIKDSKFSLIKLPVLLVTHDKDSCNMIGLAPEFFKLVFRSSPKAEIAVLSGGKVGKGPKVNHLTQKFQHGLWGNENKFVQIVPDFIDSTNDMARD